MSLTKMTEFQFELHQLEIISTCIVVSVPLVSSGGKVPTYLYIYFQTKYEFAHSK